MDINDAALFICRPTIIYLGIILEKNFAEPRIDM